MKKVVYRIHYGFEYLYKSIESIYSWADEIVVVISKEPWFKKDSVQYKGIDTKIVHPENVDYHYKELNLIPKVTAVFREYDSPWDHWGDIVRSFGKNCEYVLTLEPDMVLSDYTQLYSIEGMTAPNDPVTLHNQTEYWKNKFWQIDDRKHRCGPVLHSYPTETFTTPRNNEPEKYTYPRQQDFNKVHVDNYGFCFGADVMLYKHLLTLGTSRDEGQDSPPDENWFDMWYSWHEGVENLEISEGYQHTIKRAYPNKEFNKC